MDRLDRLIGLPMATVAAGAVGGGGGGGGNGVVNLGGRVAVVVVEVEAVDAAGRVTATESADVVLEGALVLEVGAAGAEPALAAVLLVRAPVALDGEGLGAAAAAEGPGAVLALVVRLQSAEVLERPRARVGHAVPAPGGAAVARQLQQRQRLRALERLRALAVLAPVAPHVHLHPSTHVMHAHTGLVLNKVRIT